jgi:hypothetical protein
MKFRTIILDSFLLLVFILPAHADIVNGGFENPLLPNFGIDGWDQNIIYIMGSGHQEDLTVSIDSPGNNSPNCVKLVSNVSTYDHTIIQTQVTISQVFHADAGQTLSFDAEVYRFGNNIGFDQVELQGLNGNTYSNSIGLPNTSWATYTFPSFIEEGDYQVIFEQMDLVTWIPEGDPVAFEENTWRIDNVQLPEPSIISLLGLFAIGIAFRLSLHK